MASPSAAVTAAQVMQQHDATDAPPAVDAGCIGTLAKAALEVLELRVGRTFNGVGAGLGACRRQIGPRAAYCCAPTVQLCIVPPERPIVLKTRDRSWPDVSLMAFDAGPTAGSAGVAGPAASSF